ncbi:MAG: fatty acid desaturase [Xanthomonadales bacterium]|nr:fatty acid desaturase [Xanthomonadales bacterium]
MRLNLLLAGALLAGHLAALLVVPATLGPGGGWWLLLAALALTSPALWALVHEAIHGLLLPGRAGNEALGRALAICFGAPLDPLRFAHLRHHRYNRSSIARDEVFDPRDTSRVRACAIHHLRLLGGLYVAELALNLLVWLPRRVLARLPFLAAPGEWPGADEGARRLAESTLLASAPLTRMRIDALFVLALYALAFWLAGSHWPTLLAMLAVRGLLVSALDNAYHHGTPLAPGPGNHLFALNLRAPPWLSRALLNMNLHRAHHRRVRLPWTALPAHADRHPDDPPFWSGLLRQWRGPIEVGALPGATRRPGGRPAVAPSVRDRNR